MGAELLIWLVAGYLLGSIPFGLLLTRAAGLGDVRSIGSGNIGATNVLRTGRKGLAAATLLLDGGKGAVAVLAGLWFAGLEAGLVAGVAAVLGHCFPVWLGFRGGKGVATVLGVMLAADWMLGAGACLTWLVVFLLFRFSSLAALVAVAVAPVFGFALDKPETVIYAFAALALLVWIRHHANIRRLLKGEEPRVEKKKKAV
ncbi:MAG: glycerol-3-phosphate 1-O-acyltransferase PlsY [Rhodospirillales bacterium]